jgi:AcrR family transcriptional regulator
MATQVDDKAHPRVPLNRERILQTTVTLADEGGVESLSMRRLAHALGVVPMALYRHVANKEEMLDGMVDSVVSEIDPPVAKTDWKTAVRQRVLSARRALLHHPWASRVIETRTDPTPTVIERLGCDDQFEFEFALDLMLDGLERLRERTRLS